MYHHGADILLVLQHIRNNQRCIGMEFEFKISNYVIMSKYIYSCSNKLHGTCYLT